MNSLFRRHLDRYAGEVGHAPAKHPRFGHASGHGWAAGPWPLLSRSPWSRTASPTASPIFFGATSVMNQGTTSFMIDKLLFK